MKTYRRKTLAATILLCATLCAQSGFAQKEVKCMPTAAPGQQDTKIQISSAGQQDDKLPDINTIKYAEDKNIFDEAFSNVSKVDFKNIFEDAIREDPSISKLTLTVDFSIRRESKGNQSIYTPTYDGMKVVKPLEESDEDIESESDAASNGIGIWALIVAFVVGCAAGYFIRGNNHGGKTHHDSSKKTTSMASPRKYEQKPEKSESSAMTQPKLNMAEPSRDNTRNERPDLDKKPQLKPQQEPIFSQETRPYETPQPKKIVKYGQIAVPGENELLLEEDYIVDNPANMPFEFVFDARMYEGTYDINENLRSIFAEDPDYIRPYVKPFRDVPDATRIVTVSPGKLRKSGVGWIVIEKLTIELK